MDHHCDICTYISRYLQLRRYYDNYIKTYISDAKENEKLFQIPFEITLAQALLESNTGKVGYLAFNSFIERSAQDLDDAFSLFEQEDVSELVLDLRYNGGGYLNVAKQLASQIAAENVLGKPMFNYEYNKNRETNSVDFELNNKLERKSGKSIKQVEASST